MARNACVVIDLSNVKTPKDLHNLLMEQLDFPGWYGCNWNAFWDAITGLVEMPETLQLNGWHEFESRLSGEAKLMHECLNDMTLIMYPQFASKVEYA